MFKLQVLNAKSFSNIVIACEGRVSSYKLAITVHQCHASDREKGFFINQLCYIFLKKKMVLIEISSILLKLSIFMCV